MTGMTGWTVFVKRGGNEAAVTDDAIDAFAEALADHSAAVAGGAGFSSYDATLSVDVESAEEAVHYGIELVKKAAYLAGLPDWPLLDVHATRDDELDRQLEEPNFPELVGTREIADILNVSRQRAHQLTHRDDFPLPVAELKTGPVWTRPSLNRFVEEWDRKPGRPPKELVEAVADEAATAFASTSLVGSITDAPTTSRARGVRDPKPVKGGRVKATMIDPPHLKTSKASALSQGRRKKKSGKASIKKHRRA